MLIKAFATALNFIYPFFCPSCGKYIKNRFICSDCIKKLHKINHRCLKCSYPYDSAYKGVCPDCAKYKKHFIKNESFYVLNKETLDMIHKFKYKRNYTFGRFMAEEFSRGIKGTDVECLTYVPSNNDFNHMEFAAELVSARLKLKIISPLKKKKNVVSQTKLKRKERFKNVKGAFFSKPVKNIKKIILIDDIYTTGATLNECALALKKAGVKEVYCYTFCYNKGLR